MTDTSAQSASQGQTAAFFDLDRTLLASSSAPVFAKALADVGTIDMTVPVQSVFFQLYEWFGEDPLSMRLARQGSRLFAGHRVDAVRSAGRIAAETLGRDVLPFARAEIERHRRDNTLLVLATTSTSDLVEGLAEELGFDAVIATRYRSLHGYYDGSVDGTFVWGDEKARSVAHWARLNDVDLDESWAYSDSTYDVPMLELVGNPIAVNPDARLRLTAAARGWPVESFAAGASTPRLAGIELQEALLPIVPPIMAAAADFDLGGIENIPTTGGALLAANHRSYFDPLVLALILAKIGRPARFMAKQELFDLPLAGRLLDALGVIPVDRGSGSAAPLRQAARALDAGELVVILPQGTIPRGEAFFEPTLVGRPGIARLAATTGSPVVPIGLWGTEKVWPRNASLPSFDPTNRPEVSATIGEPLVLLDTDQARENTATIMTAISELLPDVARKPYNPTADELAATIPSKSSPF